MRIRSLLLKTWANGRRLDVEVHPDSVPTVQPYAQHLRGVKVPCVKSVFLRPNYQTDYSEKQTRGEGNCGEVTNRKEAGAKTREVTNRTALRPSVNGRACGQREAPPKEPTKGIAEVAKGQFTLLSGEI